MCWSRRIVFLVFACAGFGKDVAAAEWTLTGSLEQQLQYDDNISLNPIRKDSVIGYLLTPKLQAARKTGVLDITVNGQGNIRRYNDSRWDCDNYSLGLSNSYRTGRGVFGLTGGYAVNCSYSQQITDTGLLAPNSQSENYRLSPSWAWQWTPRDQLILDASYSRTTFSDSLGGMNTSTGNGSLSLSGNDTYSVNLGANHEWSQRLFLDIKLFFSNVQYTGSNAQTQNLFGFQLDGNYAINPLWTVIAGAGPRWIDGTQQQSNDISSGQNSSLALGNVANISLSYNDQLSQFSTGYSNTVSPSAIGQTLQTHSLFVSYSYHLTRTLLVDFTSNFTLSQSIGGQAASQTNQFNRRYINIAAGITWEFMKNWQLKGGYVYKRQNFKQNINVQNLNSDSNLVMLFLTYSWDGIRTSR